MISSVSYAPKSFSPSTLTRPQATFSADPESTSADSESTHNAPPKKGLAPLTISALALLAAVFSFFVNPRVTHLQEETTQLETQLDSLGGVHTDTRAKTLENEGDIKDLIVSDGVQNKRLGEQDDRLDDHEASIVRLWKDELKKLNDSNCPYNDTTRAVIIKRHGFIVDSDGVVHRGWKNKNEK